MNRFQKKCFIAVAGMHGLLLLVLIVGTAFNSEKKIESARVITLVNAVVTDAPTQGGAPAAPAPVVKPQEIVPPAPTPPPVREPEPPKPIVEQPKPKPPPEPKKVEAEIPVPKVVETKPKPAPIPKPVVKPTRTIPDISKPTVRNATDIKASNEAAEKAAQKAAAERSELVKKSLSNLKQNLSSSTTIDLPGGLGGAAEINYGDLVLSKYDAAWIAPADVDDNEAVVKAKVVIARSGNVISADIIRASGNVVLDKSVRRALDSVRFIARFPEGSTDSQRTYTINFNLKTKRGIG